MGYRLHSPLFFLTASSLFSHWLWEALACPARCKAASTCGVAGEQSAGLIGFGLGGLFHLAAQPRGSQRERMLEPVINAAFILLPFDPLSLRLQRGTRDVVFFFGMPPPDLESPDLI